MNRRVCCQLSLLICLLFGSLAASNTVFAEDKTTEAKMASKKALNELQEHIAALKRELENAQSAHSEAADELKQSEQAISEANRKLYVLNQQHAQNDASLQTLQQQKSVLESQLQQQQQWLKKQLYLQYVHGQQSYTQTVLQQQDPSAIARQLHYQSYVAKARSQRIAAVRQNLDKVAKLNEKTATTLQEISDLQNQQQQQRLELQKQKRVRGQKLSQLSTQINAQRGEIDKLTRDEKSLSDLVERLARIISKKQIVKKNPPKSTNVQAKSIVNAKPKVQTKSEKTTTGEPVAPKPIENNVVESKKSANEPDEKIIATSDESIAKNQTPGKNEVVSAIVEASSSFASLKGRLNLPVQGQVSNRFGRAREDTGISWKGLFIKASEGAEVKSVASGMIVFADWLRGFGNLLIIDHGGGYMSLYGNNQSLLKRVGEEVKRGDVVAVVGNSGGNETSGLYYELRRQSKPFDPLSWSR